MSGSVVRSVAVKFRADGTAKYIADVEAMGAATRSAFDGTTRAAGSADKAVGKYERSARSAAKGNEQLGASARRTASDVDNQGRAFRRGGAEIDRYSGRLNLLITAGVTLGSTLTPIGATAIPLLTGLAAGFGAAAGAAGVLVLATHGIGDALKAMDAYQLQPTQANLQKLNDTMAKLGPSGREFVQYLDQIEPHLHNLQKLAEAGLLPGAEDGLKRVMTLLPQVRQIVGSLSQEIGSELASAGGHLASDSEFQHFLDYLKTDGAPTMHAFAAATGDVIAGLTQLFVDFAPANRSFAQGLQADAEAFRRWADNVGQTQGFRDFLAYIQTEGPRVIQMLSALSSALLGIIEAAAPLGDALLPILTELLNLLGAIAKSPIGPSIYTGVAAFLVFNRVASATSGLLTKLGLQTAALSGEMKGLAASTTAAGGAAGATGGLRGLLNDLAAVGSAAALTSRARAGTGSATAAAAANARVRALLGGSAVGFGSRSALYSEALPSLAALAIPGLTDKFGNLLHPRPQVGSASPSDLRQFGDYVRQHTQGFQVSDLADKTVANFPLIGNGGGIRGESSRALKSEDLGLAQLVANGQGDLAAKQYDAIKASAIKAGASVDDVQKSFKNYRAAAAAAGVSTSKVANAQRDSAQAALQQAEALKATTDAALTAFDAETQYRQALNAAADQAKKSNAGIRGNTSEALANRDALSGLAAAWNNQSDAVKSNTKRYDAARKSFVDLATGMGVPIGQARRLAQSLLEVPKSVAPTITVNTADALAGIDLVKGALANLHGKSLDVYINRIDTSGIGNANQNAQHQGRRQADGGTVHGPRHPYGDKVLSYLAPGEEVITNRHGEADRFRADRAAGRIPAYAGGGTVQSHTMAGTEQTIYTLPLTSHEHGAYLKADLALAKVTDRVKKLTDRLQGTDGNGGLQKALQDAQSRYDSLSSAIQSSLTRDLFSGGSSNPFSGQYAAGSPGFAISQLQGEKKDETDYASLVKQVMDKGITGAALSEIITNGGIDELRKFAAADISTDQQYAQLYNDVRRPAGANGPNDVGGTLAQAAAAGLSDTGVTGQLSTISAQVDVLTKQLDKANKEQAHAKARADKARQKQAAEAPQQIAQAGKAATDHSAKKAHRNTKKGARRR